MWNTPNRKITKPNKICRICGKWFYQADEHELLTDWIMEEGVWVSHLTIMSEPDKMRVCRECRSQLEKETS